MGNTKIDIWGNKHRGLGNNIGVWDSEYIYIDIGIYRELAEGMHHPSYGKLKQFISIFFKHLFWEQCYNDIAIKSILRIPSIEIRKHI